jgi:two-component system sensor histidine kinase KdpD
VSLVAMSFDIGPVLLAAALSALVWDFFFIPPRYTFSVGSPDDTLMLVMYFAIAMVNATLTYKIRQLEKQASKKVDKENTLKLYNTLLNSLSHELRTPIAAIIGATDNLQEANNKLTDENKRELLGEISTAGLRLNRQVENLLNVSRLESGVIEAKMDWCDLNELIHAVTHRLGDILAHHPMVITVPDDFPLVKLDVGLMDQVLYNLVLNAAIYTPKYCAIGIKAIAAENRLILVVEDNGNGFPMDETERVFEKFYRLSDSATGGTGLGLSIVKGFIEAHHGTVKLENLEGGGARFTMEIPTECSYLNSLKNE